MRKILIPHIFFCVLITTISLINCAKESVSEKLALLSPSKLEEIIQIMIDVETPRRMEFIAKSKKQLVREPAIAFLTMSHPTEEQKKEIKKLQLKATQLASEEKQLKLEILQEHDSYRKLTQTFTETQTNPEQKVLLDFILFLQKAYDSLSYYHETQPDELSLKNELMHRTIRKISELIADLKKNAQSLGITSTNASKTYHKPVLLNSSGGSLSIEIISDEDAEQLAAQPSLTSSERQKQERTREKQKKRSEIYELCSEIDIELALRFAAMNTENSKKQQKAKEELLNNPAYQEATTPKKRAMESGLAWMHADNALREDELKRKVTTLKQKIHDEFEQYDTVPATTAKELVNQLIVEKFSPHSALPPATKPLPPSQPAHTPSTSLTTPPHKSGEPATHWGAKMSGASALITTIATALFYRHQRTILAQMRAISGDENILKKIESNPRLLRNNNTLSTLYNAYKKTRNKALASGILSAVAAGLTIRLAM